MVLEIPFLAVLHLHDHVHGGLRGHNPQKQPRNYNDPHRAGGGYLFRHLGIINIGYVINEVGRFLSKINESED